MRQVIKAENISKQYRLGQIGTGSLKHDLNRWWHSALGKEDPYLTVGEANDRTQKTNSQYVWSLRDVNFSIHQGDSVGIIGRNGAGKSTLLKILSRVTAPTTGSLKVRGRIASLLEVGTGFHPDLSGKENIFLNGAILGMRKAEISRKFDEIVDFAGVERYIDTPVKRYSSGMYVRLAFAVAAHLESEILIVDEVLAVGDMEFQKKCLGKMDEVSRGEGRTILFVSHNMGAIASLCRKGILLEQGRVAFAGEASQAVQRYNRKGNCQEVTFWTNEHNQFKDEAFFLKKLYLADENGQPNQQGMVTNEDKLSLVFEGEVAQVNSALKIGYELLDESDNLLFTSLSTDVSTDKWVPYVQGHNRIQTAIPVHLLKPGHYTLNIHMSVHYQRYICNSENKELQLGFVVSDSVNSSPYLHPQSGLFHVAQTYQHF